MNHQFEIFKIVLDKGLLAIVVAAFTWVLMRSLERLKASLAWSGELLKQRMESSKRTLKDMRKLDHIYLSTLGGLTVEGTGIDPRTLFDAIRSVEESRIELSILQADFRALEAMEKIVKMAEDVVGAQPPGKPGLLMQDADGRTVISETPSAERVKWMEEKQRQMADAMRTFEQALAKGFPA